MSDTLDLGSWCILRMASCDTLPVTESLRDAGFDVWTPTESHLPKVRRTLFPSRRRKVEESRTAILPTFAFAAANRIGDLQRIAVLPGREHRRFHLFQHLGGYPLIAERELSALRAEEDRRQQVFLRQKRRGRKAPALARGTVVEFTEGGFAGLSGKVVSQSGKFTLVDIPGFAMPIEISSILLVDEQQVEQAA